MRLLVFFSILILIFNLGARSANGDIRFSLLGSTTETYKDFIQSLCRALTVNLREVYGIPVLPKPGTISGSKRFILVHLTSYKGISITVGIDVENVYIVAYSTGTQSFYLQDAPPEAYRFLFQGTQQIKLPFKGNYDDLERKPVGLRAKIELGFSKFGTAIENLFYNNDNVSSRKAFIVIIQTISEAARFKYIENRFSSSATAIFEPDSAFLSLENKWSDLCEQIQRAQKHGGRFETPIEVRSINNNPVSVKDVNSPVVKGIKLLLFDNKVKLVGNSTPHDNDEEAVETQSIIRPVEDDAIFTTTTTTTTLNPAGDIAAI